MVLVHCRNGSPAGYQGEWEKSSGDECGQGRGIAPMAWGDSTYVLQTSWGDSA